MYFQMLFFNFLCFIGSQYHNALWRSCLTWWNLPMCNLETQRRALERARVEIFFLSTKFLSKFFLSKYFLSSFFCWQFFLVEHFTQEHPSYIPRLLADYRIGPIRTTLENFKSTPATSQNHRQITTVQL